MTRQEELTHNTGGAFLEVESQCNVLSYLSDAFYTTGNRNMGDKIAIAAQKIMDAIDHIKDNDRERVCIQVESSLEETGSILAFALRGVNL